MSFDWGRQYLQIARNLQAGLPSVTLEAAQRCAVSRAYYAAFCHARNFARDNHGYRPTEDAEDHEKVWRHYRYTRRDIAVSGQLRNLRKWRGQCDYVDIVENLEQITASSLTAAQAIIDKLEGSPRIV